MNDKYKSEIDKLKFDLDITLKAVDTLGKGLNKLEQYNRRENVEISGIPNFINNAELEDVVINILRRIGVCRLEKWEIVGCHRLKENPGDNSANVIIRFVNRKRANQCMQNRRYLRDTINEFPRLYIHENLCPSNKSIFDKCLRIKTAGFKVMDI